MAVVEFKKKGRIAYITLNRPDQMNAMKGGKAGLSKFAREQADAAMAESRSGRIRLQ
jgi:hypothetical protein